MLYYLWAQRRPTNSWCQPQSNFMMNRSIASCSIERSILSLSFDWYCLLFSSSLRRGDFDHIYIPLTDLDFSKDWAGHWYSTDTAFVHSSTAACSSVFHPYPFVMHSVSVALQQALQSILGRFHSSLSIHINFLRLKLSLAGVRDWGNIVDNDVLM